MKIKSKILASLLLVGIVSTPLVANATPPSKITYRISRSTLVFAAWTDTIGRGYAWGDTYLDNRVTSVYTAASAQFGGSTQRNNDSGRYWAESNVKGSMGYASVIASGSGVGGQVTYDSNLGRNLIDCTQY